MSARDLPVLIPRRTLTDDDIRRRLAAGDLVRVRRGMYVEPNTLGTEWFRRADRAALAHACAVIAQSRGAVVLSHSSAALLWGLPLLRHSGRTDVTQAGLPRSHGESDVRRHTARLASDEVTTVAGVRVTSLARTLADCLRTLPGAEGLVVADAARRAGLTPEEAQTALTRATGQRGVRRAREVLAHADDGAESPGESYARASLLALGVAQPETQIRVDTCDGPIWSDLGWRAWCLLAEYDGRQKYGTAAADRDALVREKRREDAVRDEGWRVVRLTSRDVSDPQALRVRLARVAPPGALDRLTPRPHLRPMPRELRSAARGRS